MKVAIVGLGKMGGQIARKLAEGGHDVLGIDPDSSNRNAVEQHAVKTAQSKIDIIHGFNDERVVLWLMIPADLVDTELSEWITLVPKNSIIIDGGNSDFRKTAERAGKVLDNESHMLDIGTSGGVWGYENGFSMMVGGEEAAFKTIEPILKVLSGPQGAYCYFGESGSGHYVKMIHNAIEYGMMESFAEGYRMLKDGPYSNLDLAAAGDVWQKGSVVASWLNDLTRQALHEDPSLQGIEGIVAESGEARWALEVAKDMQIPLPAIKASFDVRLASQRGETNFATKLLAAMRNKFGGHNLNGK